MLLKLYQVGLQFLSDKISGGNARCIAMLLAFKEVIQDYTTPPEKTLTRDLTTKINSCVSFLTECRPLSVSMGNAFFSYIALVSFMIITMPFGF